MARGLLSTAARDLTRLPLARMRPGESEVSEEALHRAIRWLCRTHDVTGRRGSSKGYSLLHGWLPAYPETTGYVLGTLLEYAGRTGGREDLVQRAREMGAWEAEIQEPDGGIMLGHIETRPRRSIVFNTGQVLHGWVDLVERDLADHGQAADRAAGFLVENLREDGTWRSEVEYNGIPHTYNARVSWAMLRWARHAGDEPLEAAARRQLDWVLSCQRDNGWFEQCVFRTGADPSTHAIAYTLRGLLESHAITGEPRYLDAVLRSSEVLIRKLEVIGGIPANWSSEWAPTVRYECVTGNAQLGGVWLRLYQLTGDARFLNAGLKATDLAAARQVVSRSPDLDGALPGSFPVWGRYAPLQYPNWPAKFFADTLLIRATVMESL